MKLLIDECLPRALKRLFREHQCRTVQEMGWSGNTNGQLLSLAEAELDAFVTIDQGIKYQRLANRKIAVLVLTAQSNRIVDLAPLLPDALAARSNILPGRVTRVGK